MWFFPTVLWFVCGNKQCLFGNQRWMPYFPTLQKFVQVLNKLARLFALTCVLMSTLRQQMYSGFCYQVGVTSLRYLRGIWFILGLLRLFWNFPKTIPVHSNNPPSLKNKQCTKQTRDRWINLMVWRFSSQGRVRWDFTQFLGSVYPPFCHSVHPPKRWGVNAGSPEAQDRPQQPESIWPVCELWVTLQSLTTPGWKLVNLQTLPRL